MILFGIIIFSLFIAGLKTPISGFFNKGIVDALKPVLAIGIVLHHMHGESVWLHDFERWGPMIVGIFFFISGYGLSYSLQKNSDYLNGFFFKKIFIKLLIPLMLAFLLDLTINWRWESYDIAAHVLNETGPYLFPNDWFLYALIYCYILFFAAGKFHSQKARLSTLILGTLGFVIFTSSMGFARNWWATPMAFSVGAVYQAYEPKIVSMFQTKKGFVLKNVVCMFFFGVLISLSALFGRQETTVMAYSLLPLWVVLCMVHVDFSRFSSNRIVLFLGEISFEVYLIHGIIIYFMHSNTSLSGIPFALSVLAVTLVSAYLFKIVVSVVQNNIAVVCDAVNNRCRKIYG